MTQHQQEAQRLLKSRVGGYRLDQLLGVGATAAVYRATGPSGQLVALKVSRPHLIEKRRSTARFIREVQAVERIDHPGCVEIIDWGIQDDRLYIAMELVEGEDLQRVVQLQGTLPIDRALSIAIAVTEVVGRAHRLGVVHRDLKPGNIKLLPPANDDRARVKILDFGLAKLFVLDEEDSEVTVQETLTRPGATVGTPRYMAPEQILRNHEVDHRVDIYAIGVILYRMVTGRLPNEGKNAIEVLMKLSSSEPTPIREHLPDVDPQLETIVMRCLAKDPDARFRNAASLLEALEELSEELEDIKPTTVMKPGDIADMDTWERARDDATTLPKVNRSEESRTSLWSRRSGPDSVTIEAVTRVRVDRRTGTHRDGTDADADDQADDETIRIAADNRPGRAADEPSPSVASQLNFIFSKQTAVVAALLAALAAVVIRSC